MENKGNLIVASILSCFVGAAIVILINLYISEESNQLPKIDPNKISQTPFITNNPPDYKTPKIHDSDRLKTYCELVEIYANNNTKLVYIDAYYDSTQL